MARVINLWRPAPTSNPLRYVEYATSTIDPSLGTVNTNALKTVVDGTHKATDGRGNPDTYVGLPNVPPVNAVTHTTVPITYNGEYITNG